MLPIWNEVSPRRRRRASGKRVARVAMLTLFILAPLSAIALSSLPGRDPARRLLAPPATEQMATADPDIVAQDTVAPEMTDRNEAAEDVAAAASEEPPATEPLALDATPRAEAPAAASEERDAPAAADASMEAEAQPRGLAEAEEAAGPAPSPAPLRETASGKPTAKDQSASAPTATEGETAIAAAPPAPTAEAPIRDTRLERLVTAAPAEQPTDRMAATGPRTEPSTPRNQTAAVAPPTPVVSQTTARTDVAKQGAVEEAALEPGVVLPRLDIVPVPRPRPALRRVAIGEPAPALRRRQAIDQPVYPPLPPEVFARQRSLDARPPAPIPPAPVGVVDPRDGLILEGRVAPPGSRLLDLATAPFREAGRLIDRATGTPPERWRDDGRYGEEPGW
ncbi:hypothetical protein ACLE20_00800 [Rhizobium sp. YIM 134829]|uniref:hypothetical protein n=1 Tax=Rhizobium sp. YIM 134829 TaxID=3390453 RepID=UPI00397DFE7C